MQPTLALDEVFFNDKNVIDATVQFYGVLISIWYKRITSIFNHSYLRLPIEMAWCSAISVATNFNQQTQDLCHYTQASLVNKLSVTYLNSWQTGCCIWRSPFQHHAVPASLRRACITETRVRSTSVWDGAPTSCNRFTPTTNCSRSYTASTACPVSFLGRFRDIRHIWLNVVSAGITGHLFLVQSGEIWIWQLSSVVGDTMPLYLTWNPQWRCCT